MLVLVLMKQKYENLHFLLTFVTALVGGVVAVIIFLLTVYIVVDTQLIHADFCSTPANWQVCINSTKWNEATYLSLITDFYETLIAFILTLLAVLTAFTFVIIRIKTKEWVSESVEDSLESHLRSPEVQILFRKEFDLAVSEKLKTELDKVKERISDVENEFLLNLDLYDLKEKEDGQARAQSS